MTTVQKSWSVEVKSRFEFTHNWAEAAVMNLQNVASCLTWRGQDDDQLVCLIQFVGDVIEGFAALDTQKDHFDVDRFSLAIDDPVRVFDYDDAPASYHAAAVDFVYSFVLAMFPQHERSTITRQDAETLSSPDIKRIAAALSNVTGHELQDIHERLRWLAAGIAKEYARLRANAPIAACDGALRPTAMGSEGVSKNLWWHEPHERRPAEYKYGVLIGTKKTDRPVVGRKRDAYSPTTGAEVQKRRSVGDQARQNFLGSFV